MHSGTKIRGGEQAATHTRASCRGRSQGPSLSEESTYIPSCKAAQPTTGSRTAVVGRTQAPYVSGYKKRSAHSVHDTTTNVLGNLRCVLPFNPGDFTPLRHSGIAADTIAVLR